MFSALKANPLVAGRALPGEIRQRHGGIQYSGSDVDIAWGERLHAMLGAAWPCAEEEGLAATLNEIEARLAQHGLRTGRHTYGYYSDADRALCKAIWCTVRHVRPEVVIETGVAHGVSSQIVLEALTRNERGHLWSIDLPHPLKTDLHSQTGIAVAAERRSRWSYVAGPSRKRLPEVVAEVGRVDVFIHDSLHTARNTLFEMNQVSAIMPHGGIMLIDDIYGHNGFKIFARRHARYQTIICQPSDKLGVFGIAFNGG